MPDFIIYRIIGNTLPPRHDGEETWRNLAFVLEHEPDLPGCEKRWLLNGFIDEGLEARCRALIEGHGQSWHRIAFDIAPFRSAFYDSSGLPAQYKPYSPGFGGVTPLAMEWILRHKSLALINLNRARNRALELGRAEARWTLPLDGWAFFTLPAWQAFVDGVRAAPDALYALLPLARLADNALIYTPERLPVPDDEPQIAFRNDAPDRFDERRRYGNQNKVDLLRRLETPGPWHRWAPADWETLQPLPTQAPGRFRICGHVYRLASGASAQVEENSDTRHLARFQGVSRLASRLDRQLLAHHHAAGGREHAVLRRGERTPGPAALARIAALAALLARQPMPLTAATGKGAAGARDGLGRALRRAAVFAAAGIHGGERAHLEHAAGLLRAWFADPATAPSPLSCLDGKGAGPQELWLLPALCRSLVQAGALPMEARNGVRAWAAGLHDALKRPGADEAAYDHVGTWKHLLRLSLGLFLERYTDACVNLNGASLRLAAQCAPDGAQPMEADGPRLLQDSLHNITAWTLLAGLGRANGVDLWRYRGVDGESICRMTAHVIARRAQMVDAADDGRQTAWIAALCRLAPADAADRVLLPAGSEDMRLQDGDAEWGLPPLWPVYLGNLPG